MADVDERTRERYEPRWPEGGELPARRSGGRGGWILGAAVALALVLLGVALAEVVRMPAGFFVIFFFFGPWMFLRRRRRR